MTVCYVYCCCKPLPPAVSSKLSLNDYFTGKLNWFFCVGVCTNGAAAMAGRLLV